MSGNDYHAPVLLQESVDALNIRPDGTYVDCTFGGGGHSREILKRLGPDGRLIAFDQDEDARANLPNDTRILFVQHNFRHLQRLLRLHKVTGVDGILADLGVSSHQFDTADRGFSTRFDADLDMRMDQRQELTAFDIVRTYKEHELHKLFQEYGEVTNAKTLARTIVQARAHQSLKTIANFKQAISSVVRGNPNGYFAQVFQALRIAVNDEFGALKEMLEQALTVLKPGGRIAIITFHSLEDRIVKLFFRIGSHEENEVINYLEPTPEPPLRNIFKKPVVPATEEINRNPRARSAKLRVAEKVNNLCL